MKKTVMQGVDIKEFVSETKDPINFNNTSLICFLSVLSIFQKIFTCSLIEKNINLRNTLM